MRTNNLFVGLVPFLVAAGAAGGLTPQTSAAPGGSAEEQMMGAAPLAGISARVELFTPDTRTPPAPPPTPAMQKHIIRRTMLVVDDKAVASGVILTAEAQLLNIFPDVQIFAMRSRIESRSPRDYSWFGSIPGDELGHVIVTVVGGRLGALVTHQFKRYLVLPVGEGRHEAVEIDESSYPEGPDIWKGTPRDAPSGAPPSGRTVAPATLDSLGMFRLFDASFVAANGDLRIKRLRDDGRVIDLMYVYAHDAAAAVDSTIPPFHSMDPQHATPWNLIVRFQLDVDLTNQSFRDSWVGTEIRIVGNPVELVDYTEVGPTGADELEAEIDYLEQETVPDITVAREIFAADLVMMVVGDRETQTLCGRAQFGGAFSVVRSTCSATQYAVAHEIGHNLGNAHDWETHKNEDDPPEAAPLHAHGYIVYFTRSAFAYRTIMAYWQPCKDRGIGLEACPRIGRWSDPHREIAGLPLGIEPDRDNPVEAAFEVMRINDLKAFVADFRRSVCRFASTC